MSGPATAQAPADRSNDQIYSEMTALASQLQILKASGQESSTAYIEADARKRRVV